MSAEPWRRSGTPVAPRLFAWQAWYFGDLRLDLRCDVASAVAVAFYNDVTIAVSYLFRNNATFSVTY